MSLTLALTAKLGLDEGSPLLTQLYENRGPLSDFASEILMARALGIIGPLTQSYLDIVRSVRNAFAHTPRDIKFTTKEVHDLCVQLPHDPKKVTGPANRKARQAFNQYCVLVTLQLTLHGASAGSHTLS
jgi:DNA-binding MltR family transcriptional regulator